jgi:hypothetical protein
VIEMTANKTDAPATVARERIAVGAGVALLVAGLILVLVVLPAEYGVDVTGVGRRLGLTAMSDVAKQVDALAGDRTAAGGAGTRVIAPQDRAYRQETVAFRLAPREFVEYKYRLAKGEALLYSWTANGPVNVDLHAEPDGAPRGYAQSYEKRDRITQAAGTLTAPFSGIHGWYWQNQSDREVTVTLASAGFYNISHEFRDGQPAKNKIFQ